MSEEKNAGVPDLKEKVMGDIRCGKVRIICPMKILARKLGFEGLLVFSLFFGAFFLSVLFYFLKKNGLLKFVSLGIPGLKVFLSTLPYDYIVLFVVSFFLAVWAANQLDLSYQSKISGKIFMGGFLLLSVFLGTFFVFSGAHKFFSGWSKNKIPRDRAVWGRVIELSPREVIIQDEDGRLVRVEIEKGEPLDFSLPSASGKFLRAVGSRDLESPEFFHAESVLCCDDY